MESSISVEVLEKQIDIEDKTNDNNQFKDENITAKQSQLLSMILKDNEIFKSVNYVDNNEQQLNDLNLNNIQQERQQSNGKFIDTNTNNEQKINEFLNEDSDDPNKLKINSMYFDHDYEDEGLNKELKNSNDPNLNRSNKENYEGTVESAIELNLHLTSSTYISNNSYSIIEEKDKEQNQNEDSIGNVVSLMRTNNDITVIPDTQKSIIHPAESIDDDCGFRFTSKTNLSTEKSNSRIDIEKSAHKALTSVNKLKDIKKNFNPESIIDPFIIRNSRVNSTNSNQADISTNRMKDSSVQCFRTTMKIREIIHTQVIEKTTKYIYHDIVDVDNNDYLVTTEMASKIINERIISETNQINNKSNELNLNNYNLNTVVSYQQQPTLIQDDFNLNNTNTNEIINLNDLSGEITTIVNGYDNNTNEINNSFNMGMMDVNVLNSVSNNTLVANETYLKTKKLRGPNKTKRTPKKSPNDKPKQRKRRLSVALKPNSQISKKRSKSEKTILNERQEFLFDNSSIFSKNSLLDNDSLGDFENDVEEQSYYIAKDKSDNSKNDFDDDYKSLIRPCSVRLSRLHLEQNQTSVFLKSPDSGKITVKLKKFKSKSPLIKKYTSQPQKIKSPNATKLQDTKMEFDPNECILINSDYEDKEFSYKKNDHVFALWKEDQCYYAAQILKINSHDELQIKYLSDNSLDEVYGSQIFGINDLRKGDSLLLLEKNNTYEPVIFNKIINTKFYVIDSNDDLIRVDFDRISVPANSSGIQRINVNKSAVSLINGKRKRSSPLDKIKNDYNEDNNKRKTSNKNNKPSILQISPEYIKQKQKSWTS